MNFHVVGDKIVSYINILITLNGSQCNRERLSNYTVILKYLVLSLSLCFWACHNLNNLVLVVSLSIITACRWRLRRQHLSLIKFIISLTPLLVRFIVLACFLVKKYLRICFNHFSFYFAWRCLISWFVKRRLCCHRWGYCSD